MENDKIKGGGDIQTNRQQGDLITVLLFLKNKENMVKMRYDE
jgi:hypothetical protein